MEQSPMASTIAFIVAVAVAVVGVSASIARIIIAATTIIATALDYQTCCCSERNSNVSGY